MTALAISALLFRWSWETPVSILGVVLGILAWNYGSARLAKALTPKYPLLAKIGPNFLVIGLGIWAIEARVCGEKSYLWLEICLALIFLLSAWNFLVYFRDKLAEEQQDLEDRTEEPSALGGER
jgi:hypothetical protein